MKNFFPVFWRDLKLTESLKATMLTQALLQPGDGMIYRFQLFELNPLFTFLTIVGEGIFDQLVHYFLSLAAAASLVVVVIY